MKKIIAGLFALLFVLPLAAAADSTDDIIANLLSSLDGPAPRAPRASGTSTPPLSPVTALPPKAQSAPKVELPSDAVLAPLHLFNVDGNTPASAPDIRSLQQLLASTLAQYAALSVRSSASSTVLASSTSPGAMPAASTPPAIPMFRRDLVLGARGADVKKLQELLIARGFLFGEPTGYYGILTKTAVLTFQTDQRLDGVGTVGPRTRAVLNSLPPDEPRADVPPFLAREQPAQAFIASSTSVRPSASSTSYGLRSATSSVYTRRSASSTEQVEQNASSTAATSTRPYERRFDPTAPAVSVSMSLLPTEAPVGGSVSVTWLSQNADRCVASDGWDGAKSTLGAVKIGPLAFSLNFVITCSGPGGEASTTALVVVGGEQ